MCSSQNETKIPTPPLTKESNGFKNWCKDIRKIILPDKPKKLRDLSEHTFKDSPYKKVVLTQIEKVKKKHWWDK